MILPGMKNSILLLSFILALLGCSSGFKANEESHTETTLGTDYEKAEMNAILKVIEEETDCFFKRDYECWKIHFVQEDYSFQAWNNEDGTVDTKCGWQKIDSSVKAYLSIKDGKRVHTEASDKINDNTGAHPVVIRKNMIVKFFSKELAYLMWDQYNSDSTGASFIKSKDCRMMQKISGRWKIANVSSFWDYRTRYSDPSNL
ncbi:MAG: hypothetical protein WAT19_13125 [Ferruginibacter sp.]